MRTGRPPKAPGEVRSQELRVRATTAEIDRAYRVAGRQGRTLAAVVRDSVRLYCAHVDRAAKPRTAG
jgi:hypothetical protein